MSPKTITGEWKEFEFQMILEHHFPNVFKHFQESYYKDEPIQQLVGTSEERENDSNKRLAHFLRLNKSFMAIEQNTGKVAGVLIMADCRTGNPEPEFETTSPLTLKVRSVVKILESSVDIFTQFEVDNFAEIHTISVSKEFQGVGLATEMCRRAIDWAFDMGYPLIMSEFSNPRSRRVGEKLGFVEVNRIYFVDFKDEKGVKILPKASPDQFVNITVLKLK